jgi:hypothetical protein
MTTSDFTEWKGESTIDKEEFQDMPIEMQNLTKKRRFSWGDVDSGRLPLIQNFKNQGNS